MTLLLLQFISGFGTIAPAPGDMAQLGERCLRMAEATGSNPVISTSSPETSCFQGFCF